MSKSIEGSSKSMEPRKRGQKPAHPNLLPDRLTLPQILKTLTLREWVAILSVLIALIAVIFKAGIEYHKFVMSKEEEIAKLISEIRELKDKVGTLSGERNMVERGKRPLYDNIDSLAQSNKFLKQDLQNANKELMQLNLDIQRLNAMIDSLEQVGSGGHDTTSHEVDIELSGFNDTPTNFRIFLNDTLMAQGSQDRFKLKAATGRYSLRIRYADRANRTWEYTGSILFARSASKTQIDKSKFKLRRYKTTNFLGFRLCLEPI